MAIKSFSDGVSQLNDTVPRLQGGISWCMLTLEENAPEPWKLHIRNNQPCYGEMRKYKTSHPDECTQPEDRRPPDLHHPFPLGVPMALGVKFGHPSSGFEEAAKSIFHPIHSPWKNGFKKPELLMGNGYVQGVSFYDTSFDPTVLVHALKLIRSCVIYSSGAYSTFRSIGLEPYQALIASNMFQSYHPNSEFYPFYTVGNFTPRFSVRKFNDKDPLDLTGGTFRSRFDYNRKKLNFIFHDEADGIDISKEVTKRVGQGYNKIIPATRMAEAIKEVLT